MPLVKVEVAEGYCKESLMRIKNTIMDAVVEVLQLPKEDRNIRLIEYSGDMFEMNPPYKLLIEICMFAGRSVHTKKLLYRTIVDDLCTTGLMRKEEIFIVLNEQPLENWGIRGGVPANEIDLGFKVYL